ncbi:hypothetical protein B0H19DRAFT_1270075 [Mycena capillaripes]|nr:hypothetical protein B0H19DRAFT_1270075 [Mycena capillaripes]
MSQQKHSSLVDFLETPCLQTLATHDTTDKESVLGLVTRSDCATFLKSFHFHSSSINQSAILQKMPRLMSLRIGHFNETLLTQSFSLPAFISTFWSQWLKQKEECVGAERRLSVRITN